MAGVALSNHMESKVLGMRGEKKQGTVGVCKSRKSLPIIGHSLFYLQINSNGSHMIFSLAKVDFL